MNELKENAKLLIENKEYYLQRNYAFLIGEAKAKDITSLKNTILAIEKQKQEIEILKELLKKIEKIERRKENEKC